MSALHQPLAKNLRTQLENTVKAARDVAEIAARATLTNLGVGDRESHAHLSDEQKALRRRLRAHGRQLGDIKHPDDSQEIRHLVWEVAYEQWHRMLFARFLAENNLLMWEPGAPVTLAECDELAQDVSTSLGAKSGWELACILAARMLPQIFKPQSPALAVNFALEHQRELEQLLSNLENDVFIASDSLGWVYQFWQSKRKDEVNASEVKIGADELPAVTQLFTEPYMVEFLLHNSLGAWWHTRHPGELCPVELTYLRTLDDGAPAAGKFEEWPATLAELKLLDPCCGSGHFLVAAFLLLVPMRMASEGLTAMDAVDLVLQDNLHGLEIDPRCVEIAVFALALTAWNFSDEDGNPLGVRADMPVPNIACCGLKVAGRAQDWEALVADDAINAEHLRQGLNRLHETFTQAPLLGSLLDPSKANRGDLFAADYSIQRDLLKRALATEYQSTLFDEMEGRWDLALSAQGLLEAARLLDQRYHLVITNVPYLARGKQTEALRSYCEQHYPEAKNDLANVFLERCLELTLSIGGFAQVVMTQNWLYLSSFRTQRESLLRRCRWNMLTKLGGGAEAFDCGPGNITNICMFTVSNFVVDDPTLSVQTHVLRGIDVTKYRSPLEKAVALTNCEIASAVQFRQLDNANFRILFEGELADGIPLKRLASALAGCTVGDVPCFVRNFWEISQISKEWEFHQITPSRTAEFDGRSEIIFWEEERGAMFRIAQSVKNLNHVAQNWLRGKPNWSKKGIIISLMGNLPVTLYGGDRYATTCTSLVLNDQSSTNSLLALWTFCKSEEFSRELRKLSQKISIEVKTILDVPFNEEYWAGIAAEQYPNGLPKQCSDDPTQWIFHGHPQASTDPLQVAVARLLGYTWPAESDDEMELSKKARKWIARCESLDSHVDDDGIVCLSPVRGEKAAHERLLALLIESWETVELGSWKASVLDRLLADVDCSGKGLDVWLREKFFEQHAKRFHHRPFIWHVWDGLKDGFGALVNYHKLDAKNLERLIHTYLGDWIRIQEAGAASGVDGAQIRLAAARQLKSKLEAILEGDAPFDIFVRWKPLDQQSIGWNPDLNDGVRMNVRPFMAAEVLRHNKKPKLNISWDKDRGKDVVSAPWFHKFDGERINDHHLTLAEKIAAKGSEI